MKIIEKIIYKNKNLLTVFSLLVLITMAIVLISKTAYAYEGWKLSLNWKDSTDTDTNYIWSSDKDEEKTVRLNVKYSNSNVGDTGYKAGELVITVPGIGDANREKNLEGVIGANKVTDTEKTRDWTYTYNSATNTYTFTNNKDIPAKYNLSGQFELVWQMKSRQTKDGYTNNLKAELLTPMETIESNTVRYTETRVKDIFKIDQYAMAMYGAQGIEAGLNIDDYIWVRYNVAATYSSVKSIGVKDDLYYEIKVPDGAIVTASTTGEVEKIDNTTYKIKTQYKKFPDGTKIEDTTQYHINDDINNMANITTRYYVAYPKNTYQAQNIASTVNLKGTYFEESDVSTLATTTKQISLADFNFIDIPGGIYNTEKCMHGSAKYDEAMDEYDKIYCNRNYITYTNGNKLQNNEINNIEMYGTINTNGTKYSMEMVDDFLYIKQNDGNLRALTENDYEFVDIYIPPSISFVNYNNMPIEKNKYKIEIYANGILYKTVRLGDGQKLQLPAGTNKIAVKMLNVEETIANIYFDISIKYHIEDVTNIDITNSSIYNTMYTKIYDESGSFINNNFTKDTYDNTTNIDFAKKDMDIYGTYLDREKAEIHIHERSNTYCNTTDLSDIKQVNNGFDTTLTMGTTYGYLEGETLSSTGVYTILPEGLTLPNGYKSLDDIYKYIEVTGSTKAYDNNYIANHMRAIVIENYNNTKSTYLGFKFDFSDNPVVEPSNIMIKVKLFISSENYQIYKDNWNVSTASFIDDGDLKELCSKTEDIEDLDNDGNTTETISKGTSSKSIVYAASSESRTLKQVSTLSNNYEYVTEKSEADLGNIYQYKLLFELGQNKGKNIVITDIFEDEDGSQWQGTFDGVDLSNIEGLGFAPIIEYTTDKTTWNASYTTKESVKGIRVTLNEKVLEPGQVLSAIVNMKAPTDTNLLEKVAKNSYHSVYTAIDASTNIETESVNQTSNITEVTLIDMVNVKLLKLDNEDNTPISGAVFTLYDESDNNLGDYVSNAKGIVDINIKVKNATDYKNYKLIEKEAPRGYILEQTPVTFSIDGTDLELSKNNNRTLTLITLTKENSLDNKFGVAGATYTLYKDDVAIGDYTTNEAGTITVEVPWGHSYYFKEKTSPENFKLNEKEIHFEVTKQNLEYQQTYQTIDEQINQGYVLLTKYESLEDETTTENPLKGATYNLYRAQDNSLVGTYVTDSNGTILVGNLAIGSYYFKEVNAPLGYIANPEKVEFTITKDNLSIDTSTKVTDYNRRKPGEVLIKKTDSEGYQLEGVVFELYHESDESEKVLVGTFTTNEYGLIQLTDLKWGTYYLKEIKSQDGYELLGEDTTFVVDAKSVSKGSFNVEPITIINKEKTGSIKFTKTAEDETTPVEGATYSLYQTDGTLVKENLITDANGVISITGLAWGSYYLEEVEAPTGYGISSEKIRFSINNLSAGTTQDLSAVDKTDSKQVEVTKKIKISDIVYDHGNATFIFKLSGKDVTSKEHTYYKTITFTKEYVDDFILNNPTFEYVSQTAIFGDIPAGNYILEEEKTQRYETGEVTSDTGIVTDKKVTFNLTTNTKGDATYTNNNTKQSKITHTSILTNIIKSSKKYTAISVKYFKNEVEQGEAIDRNKLEVYAIYDDGTSKKLKNNDYTLSVEGDKIPTNAIGTYSINVSYTESGITKKGNFAVSIAKALNNVSNCDLPGHENIISCKVLANGVGTGTNVIDKTTDQDTYFIEGESPNNWLYYSGKLWRIISINSITGTVKMVSQDSVVSFVYNQNSNYAYESSYLDNWFSEVFEPTLYNAANLVETSLWDVTETYGTDKPTYEKTITRKVGLLSAYEFVNSYKTTSQNLGYLNLDQEWWTMTYNQYEVRYISTNGNMYGSNDGGRGYATRPAINLVSGVKVTSGDGTKNNPYKIEGDISTATNGDSLNTRLSGEYIKFNGLTYRIVGTETQNGEKLTKITLYDYLRDSSNNIIYKRFNTTNGELIYNPNDVNSEQAYYLNTDPSGFYQTLPSNYQNMIAEAVWNLGQYKSGADYHDTTNTASGCNNSNICTVTAKVGLPRGSEIWSSQYDRPYYNNKYYWLLSPYNTNLMLSVSSWGYLSANSSSDSYSIRPSMYLKSNIQITSGDGTIDSPYEIE